MSILSSALSRIADGSLGEAGAGLWRSLSTIVRNTLGGDAPSALLAPAGELTPAAVSDVSALLVDEAGRCAELGVALDEWLARAAVEVSNAQANNAVVGNVSGNAKIVQAGRIDSVRFG